MITIAQYREAFKAHIAKGKLEAQGIPVVVLDEQMATINWLYSNAIGGVKVQVPSECKAEALKILGEDSEAELEQVSESKIELDQDDRCPYCQSSDVNGAPYSKWSAIPSLLLMVPFLFRKKKWACGGCGKKW